MTVRFVIGVFLSSALVTFILKCVLIVGLPAPVKFDPAVHTIDHDNIICFVHHHYVISSLTDKKKDIYLFFFTSNLFRVPVEPDYSWYLNTWEWPKKKVPETMSYPELSGEAIFTPLEISRLNLFFT